MEKFEVFYYLKVILLFYGIIKFDKTKKFHIMCQMIVIRSVTLLINVFFIAITFEMTFLSTRLTNSYHISHLIKSWIVFITYSLLYRKIDKIFNVLAQNFKKLEKCERRLANILSAILLMLWILMVLLNAVVFVCLQYKRDQILGSAKEFLWAFYGFGWITACVLFYIYTAFSVHMIERKVYFDVRLYEYYGKSNPENSFLSIKELRINILSIHKCKQSINDEIGFLPFFWCLELFSATCLRLTQISIDKNKYSYQSIIEYFFEFMLLCILYILLIICLCYFQSKRPKINSILLWIDDISSKKSLTLQESNEKNSIIQEIIGSYPYDEYMAWNTFTMDRVFAFGFLGAVIPFSVMLIQMLGQNIQ
jgi:hypothetical protein